MNGGSSRERVFVARFGPAGGRDQTFGGGDGIVALPSPFAEGFGVAVAPDGHVYVAGLAKPGGRPGRTFSYVASAGDEKTQTTLLLTRFGLSG